ncbi:MAG: type II secretion system F family protein [Planctomycetota bacterium]|nr:MAG: type II secretion system F family protein [Planctomycetota bacterium]
MSGAHATASNAPPTDAAMNLPAAAAAPLHMLAPLVPASYRRQLMAAGITDPNAQASFLAMHVLTIGVGALAAVWLLLGKNPSLTVCLPAALIGGMAGWWIPRSWLEGKQSQRRIDILTDFPVMLDLMQISLEGGMGLPAAWDVVTATITGSGDAMAQEMRRVSVEVNFGASWRDALDGAYERTGVMEFRSLGSLLQQTERFGTELSKMILVLSDSLRNEELESLEERANQASVLVLIPIGGLLLPSMLLLLAGPPLIMIVETVQRVNPD